MSSWISASNLGELWFACVMLEGEQSRNDEGRTDIVWLQMKVTNLSFPTLSSRSLHTRLFGFDLLLT